jgi:hypothetical protein
MLGLRVCSGVDGGRAQHERRQATRFKVKQRQTDTAEKTIAREKRARARRRSELRGVRCLKELDWDGMLPGARECASWEGVER